LKKYSINDNNASKSIQNFAVNTNYKFLLKAGPELPGKKKRKTEADQRIAVSRSCLFREALSPARNNVIKKYNKK